MVTSFIVYLRYCNIYITNTRIVGESHDGCEHDKTAYPCDRHVARKQARNSDRIARMQAHLFTLEIDQNVS